jgi:hypothetical protein
MTLSVTTRRSALGSGVALVLSGAVLLTTVPESLAVQERSGHTYVQIFPAFSYDGTPRNYERPRAFAVSASDSGVRFKRLAWQSWGGSSSTAHGSVQTCDATGCVTATARLTASHRIRCNGHFIYQRLVASRIPEYGPRSVAINVQSDCPAA